MVTELKKTADAVVIGGGVHGLSTALHLAKRGMKQVVDMKSASEEGCRLFR